eukprot:1068616-Pelagomonas_calceolata.AAC.2
MATNRHDTLDPALLRPGRLDRKIEFPTPDRRQKRLIFQEWLSNFPASKDLIKRLSGLANLSKAKSRLPPE